MTDVLRAHAEQQFADELEALERADDRPRPPGWRLSPWAVGPLRGVLVSTFKYSVRFNGRVRIGPSFG